MNYTNPRLGITLSRVIHNRRQLSWIYSADTALISLTKCHPLYNFISQNEQVLETGHQKFNKVYEWYKVKDVTKEKHGIKMLRCLNHFNSFNAN